MLLYKIHYKKRGVRGRGGEGGVGRGGGGWGGGEGYNKEEERLTN